MLFANALPPLSVNVPPSTTVAPLNVFTPLSVSSPLPAFVKSNAPLTTPLSVTPLATVSVVAALNAAFPLAVNTPVFTESPKANPPLKIQVFPNERADNPSLEIFPPLNVTVPVPNAESLPTKTTPELTVIPPPNVFTPLNVSVPPPLFTNTPDAPLKTPEKAMSVPPPRVSVLV
jgi:hypothetical protein